MKTKLSFIVCLFIMLLTGCVSTGPKVRDQRYQFDVVDWPMNKHLSVGRMVLFAKRTDNMSAFVNTAIGRINHTMRTEGGPESMEQGLYFHTVNNLKTVLSAAGIKYTDPAIGNISNDDNWLPDFFLKNPEVPYVLEVSNFIDVKTHREVIQGKVEISLTVNWSILSPKGTRLIVVQTLAENSSRKEHLVYGSKEFTSVLVELQKENIDKFVRELKRLGTYNRNYKSGYVKAK